MDEAEDRLWGEIDRQAHEFDALTSHNSDLFSLLAVILAYYEVRGTPPEKMIGKAMQERIEFWIQRPAPVPHDPRTAVRNGPE